MPKPRYRQVFPELTPYYHCISRCVRRAFLCGRDPHTGRNFDHRKTWIVDLLAHLTSIFAIDVVGYAVLSSHFHVIVRLDPQRVRSWTDTEVLERTKLLFPGAVANAEILPPEKRKEKIDEFRSRLGNLSWFMRYLDESIARRANKEDGCKGRFWEGRFRSRAILDEGGLLTCMAYVDLNAVRAQAAESLEESDFTSIQQRLWELAREMHGEQQRKVPRPKGKRLPKLIPFAGSGREGSVELPTDFRSYVELVEWTGSAVRKGKRGALPRRSQNLLRRLGLEPEVWVEAVEGYEKRFFGMVGHVHRIDLFCQKAGQKYAKGSRWAARLYGTAA